MLDRGRLLVGTSSTLLASRASAAPQLQETADVDRLGVLANRAWRLAYAECLAGSIEAAQWA
jgi:hypothetical protein